MKVYNQPPKGFASNYPTENIICLPSKAVARFGKGSVSDVAVSPDGYFIAVASRIGVWIYNAHTGEFVSLIGVESTGVLNTVTFSPDCSRLALGDWDGRITLWDIGTKENIWCVTHEKRVSSIRFSATGRYLETVLSDGVVNILRVDDGTRVTKAIKETFSENRDAHEEKWKDKNISKALANHSRHDHGWLVAFSHHGKHLAGLNKADTLTLWEIATGKQTSTLERVTGHGEWVSIFRGRTLVCSPEGRYRVISFFNTEHHTVTLWNEKTVTSFTSDMPILSAAASPNGRLLATGGWDKSVTLWNIETQKPFCTLEGHIGEISDLAFSPDGSLLVSGGARSWEYEKDEDGSTLRPEEFYTFQLGADGTVRYFSSGNNPTDTTAKIWEISTGRNIVTLKHPDVINQVAFSPEGTWLATSTRKTIILWCTQTWQSVATLDTVKIESLAFSPDGARLAVGGTWPEQKIQIWDVKMAELVVEFSGHKSDVESLAFSPEGHLLASGGFDGVIYLWDMTPYR